MRNALSGEETPVNTLPDDKIFLLPRDLFHELPGSDPIEIHTVNPVDDYNETREAGEITYTRMCVKYRCFTYYSINSRGGWKYCRL